MVYGVPARGRSFFISSVDFVAQHQETLRQAFTTVREHLRTAANRRKHQYDSRTRSTQYEVGTFVWMLVPRRRPHRNAKWQNFYEGPFLVVRQIWLVYYVIQRSSRSKLITVHVDKLKPCHIQELSSWLTTDTEGPTPATDAAEHESDTTTDVSNNSVNEELVSRRPRRSVRKPARFYDD